MLWIGTQAGLKKFIPSSPQQEAGEFIDYQTDPVYSIYEDRLGALWIGASSGLKQFHRESGQFTHYRHNPDDPNSLAEDRVFFYI